MRSAHAVQSLACSRPPSLRNRFKHVTRRVQGVAARALGKDDSFFVTHCPWSATSTPHRASTLDSDPLCGPMLPDTPLQHEDSYCSELSLIGREVDGAFQTPQSLKKLRDGQSCGKPEMPFSPLRECASLGAVSGTSNAV